MEKDLNITKLHYSKQILPVPWPFIISRFHCTTVCGDTLVSAVYHFTYLVQQCWNKNSWHFKSCFIESWSFTEFLGYLHQNFLKKKQQKQGFSINSSEH